MVWRSLFKLTTTIIQYTNNQTFIVTNYLISALLKSITSINNDLSIDALNVVAALCSLFSKRKLIIDIILIFTDKSLFPEEDYKKIYFHIRFKIKKIN
jgi:hypothetical protein